MATTHSDVNTPGLEGRDPIVDHEKEVLNPKDGQTRGVNHPDVPQVRMLKPYAGEVAPERVGVKNLGALTLIAKLAEEKIKQANPRPLLPGSDFFYQQMMQSLPPVRLTLENLDLKDFIGFGGYGKVFKAGLRTSHAFKDVAVKVVGCSKNIPDLYKERDLLIKLQHKRVVYFEGVFNHGPTFFVMELCYGSVTQLYARMDEVNKIRFVVHLLEGLEWIHSQGIIHCDIRPDNLLINEKNLLKIADFGSAQLIKGEELVKSSSQLGVAGYQDEAANEKCIYSKGSDIFSAACSIFEMMTGQYLLRYHNHQATCQNYVEAIRLGRLLEGGKREHLSVRATKDKVFGELVIAMTKQRGRITAAAAVIHPTTLIAMKTYHVTMEMIDDYNEESQKFTNQFPKNTTTTYEKMGTASGYNIGNTELISIYYDAQSAHCSNTGPSRQFTAASGTGGHITMPDTDVLTRKKSVSTQTVATKIFIVEEVKRLIGTACGKLSSEMKIAHKGILDTIRQSGPHTMPHFSKVTDESNNGVKNVTSNENAKEKSVSPSKSQSGDELESVLDQRGPAVVAKKKTKTSVPQVKACPSHSEGGKTKKPGVEVISSYSSSSQKKKTSKLGPTLPASKSGITPTDHSRVAGSSTLAYSSSKALHMPLATTGPTLKARGKRGSVLETGIGKCATAQIDNKVKKDTTGKVKQQPNGRGGTKRKASKKSDTESDVDEDLRYCNLCWDFEGTRQEVIDHRHNCDKNPMKKK